MRKNFVAKIVISFIALGIFLLPISATFQNSNGILAVKSKTNIALADPSTVDWWYEYNTAAGVDTIVGPNNKADCLSDYGLTVVGGASPVRTCFESASTPTLTSTQLVTTESCPQGQEGTPPNCKKIIPKSYSLGCSLTDGWDGIGGCIAALTYYVVFVPAAALARLAGYFLDFFVYYSTNSSSYTNGFISTGWAVVRDIANIFFIIALLYVAIKTILGMGHDGKKMIGYIVVVALLINFSLFFTQVIIDGSNILAKVFYNHITNIDKNGKPLDPNMGAAGGQKSISVSIVAGFNPKDIIDEESYHSVGSADGTGGIGMFIFITLLAAALCVYIAFIFFSVGLLFVGRVVALWISMIFSPLAFASYTMPIDIPGFGHKEWWKELLSNAFLAPLFIFMLYIILLFIEGLKKITYGTADPNATFFDKAMHVIIPFIIIVVLLMKAKELAIKYSGEMGAMFAKAGGAISGAVVGGAIGVGALAARSTLGRASNALGNSKMMQTWEAKGWGGGAVRKMFEKGGKASFDVRGTGLTSGVGSAAKGGFAGAKERQIAERLNRAKSLEAGENSKEKQDVYKAQAAVKEAEANPKVQEEIRQANIVIKNADIAIDAQKEKVADAEKKVADADKDIKEGENDIADGERQAKVVSDQLGKLTKADLDGEKGNELRAELEAAKNKMKGGQSKKDAARELKEKPGGLLEQLKTEKAELKRLDQEQNGNKGEMANAQKLITSGEADMAAAGNDSARKAAAQAKIDAGKAAMALADGNRGKLKRAEKPIEDAKLAEKKAKLILETHNIEIRQVYATTTESDLHQIISVISGESTDANTESANKIRAQFSGGGSHSSPTPAPAAKPTVSAPAAKVTVKADDHHK
ncbi:MAG: hypothetical protein NTZ44_01175 [Candidatus Nomurabacteria bacterium]|nr:hypothetical protein [Candidatus Nomurabacteria bacterium]